MMLDSRALGIFLIWCGVAVLLFFILLTLVSPVASIVGNPEDGTGVVEYNKVAYRLVKMEKGE